MSAQVVSDVHGQDAVWDRTGRLLLWVCCLVPISGPLADDGPGRIVRLNADSDQTGPSVVGAGVAARASGQRGSQLGPLSTHRILRGPGLIGPRPNAADGGHDDTRASVGVRDSEAFGHSVMIGFQHPGRHPLRTGAEPRLSGGRSDLVWSAGTPKLDTSIRSAPGKPDHRLLRDPVSDRQLTVEAGEVPPEHVDLGNGVWPWPRPVSPVSPYVNLVSGQATTVTTGKLLGAGHSAVHSPPVARPVLLGGHSFAGTGIDVLDARRASDDSEATVAEGSQDSQAVAERPFDPDPGASITANKAPAQWAIVRTDGPLGMKPLIAADPALDRSCWMTQPYHWDASGLYHNPLYFEDRGLERYGHTVARVQPFLSAASFAADFARLPVNAVLNPWCRSVYSLGYPRPGSPSSVDPKPPQGEFEYLSNGAVYFGNRHQVECVESLPVEASAQELYEPAGQ